MIVAVGKRQMRTVSPSLSISHTVEWTSTTSFIFASIVLNITTLLSSYPSYVTQTPTCLSNPDSLTTNPLICYSQTLYSPPLSPTYISPTRDT